MGRARRAPRCVQPSTLYCDDGRHEMATARPDGRSPVQAARWVAWTDRATSEEMPGWSRASRQIIRASIEANERWREAAAERQPWQPLKADRDAQQSLKRSSLPRPERAGDPQQPAGRDVTNDDGMAGEVDLARLEAVRTAWLSPLFEQLAQQANEIAQLRAPMVRLSEVVGLLEAHLDMLQAARPMSGQAPNPRREPAG